jgi:histone H3/H4
MDIENITKPSITRLARKAGVKSVSDECFDTIRKIMYNKLSEVISAALIVNSEHQTKTLMAEDIYDSFSFVGQNLTQSSDLGKTTCSK